MIDIGNSNILPSIKLQTRLGTDINNNQIDNLLPLLDVRMAEEIRRNHCYALYRTNPCGYYNCHGMTFASRRSRVWQPSEIAKILREDGYYEVNEADVLPADVVVYYQKGDAQHSGIVLEVILTPYKNFKIVSKWGHGHEVIHLLRDCPYSEDADVIKYYRITSVHYGDS